VVPPDGPDDLTFVCDYPAAVALARGETNAQAALMDGRLRLRGDVERVAEMREALVALGDVLGRVRAVTAF
jgi:putative sterol carrier protein